MNRIKYVQLFMILILVLAACTGGGDDEEPTAGESLPESLQNSIDASSPPPISGADQPFMNSTLPSFLSSGPTTPVPANPGEVITDFSTLEAGTNVTLRGTASTRMTESGGQQVILTDSNGISINVILPPPMLTQINENEVEWSGNITGSAEAGGLLTLSIGTSGFPSFNPGGEVPSFITGEQPPPDPANQTTQNEVVQEAPTGFSVDANLTALQTYDAVLAQAAGFLADYQLVSITGANEIGWSIEFRNSAISSSVVYTISPEGTVVALTAVSDAAFNALDRSQITVDSDAARDQLGVPDEGLSILSLAASDTGNPQWVVVDGAESVPANQ